MNLIRIALKNSVAMNLLLIVLLAWGMASFYQVPREMFPEFQFDLVNVSVSYPGASPDEIEESITTPIEERVSRITGIEEIRSTSSESFSSLMIEVSPDFDPSEIRDKIESEINQIVTFPRDAERPKVIDIIRKTPAIFVGIYGDVSEEGLKSFADGIRDELLLFPTISQVDYLDAQEREISIEVSEEKLRQHGLNFNFIADRIRRNSINLPGGTIKSRQGEILVRTMDQKYTGQEMEGIILLSTEDGSRVLLKDVAEIKDSFKDIHSASLLDGVTAKVLRIYKTGNQDLIHITDVVKEFVENKQKDLPGNIKMITWGDVSRMVKGRLALMERNGYMGLILVFLALTLFLELRLAFFVALGIPVSFLGSFIFMNYAGQSINMISMFGMILVLGIVVDDAVVVSESIFQKMQEGKNRFEAAFYGTI
ncbi:efflux RND transporter permease subunit, partial [bacterium]|nr:efflux RND transporter permease subunit [bacterium]